jgi:flagellar hook protein FlgE
MEVGLTDMIILQRAYQANAKTITTVDEMIQKALQMRR